MKPDFRILSQSKKIDSMYRARGQLEEKLGALVLQLPPRLKVENLPALWDLLTVLPDEFSYAVEFRNRGWFTEDVFKLLRENHVALVQVEHPKLSTTTELAADHIYIRWEGDRKVVSGEKGDVELDRSEDNYRWASQIKELLDSGHEVFGYFSKFYSGYPPADIWQITDLLRNFE